MRIKRLFPRSRRTASRYCYCTKCNAVLDEQAGFENNDGTWECTVCGQLLFGDTVRNPGRKYQNVIVGGEVMPYIPKEHAQYDLLPRCRECGGEVFSYPSDLIDEVEAHLPEGESLTPYGYDSYEEYDAQIETYREQYAYNNPELDRALTMLKTAVHRMNIKENWTVVRYIGESTDTVFGLTKGRCYYWPCSKEQPEYIGVIDDEEFTSYLYSTESELWEVLTDPLGITSVMKNA